MALLQTTSKKEILEQITILLQDWGTPDVRRDFAALALGVSRRTVDGWCSPADPRQIPADKLMRLYVESAIRIASAVEEKYLIDVYDGDDDLILVTDDAPIASFIADTHGGRMAYRKRRQDWIYGENAKLRSRLRRIVKADKIPSDIICGVLGCDSYGLITFQVESPRFRRTPSEHQIATLEDMEPRWAEIAA